MSLKLIKKLKSSKEEDREAIAMELAKTGSIDAIAELFRMVEGRHRRRLSWYNITDQLTGVKALSETNDKDALEYLKRIYNYKDVTVTEKWQPLRRGGVTNPEDYVEGTITFENYTYPNAKGSLAFKLQYNEIISVVDENDRNWSKHDFGWPSNYGEDKDYEVHKTFTQAIKKLEDSLQ